MRGAGPCFSSGYDLKSDLGSDQPYFTPNVGMQWARHVSEGWMSLWDLAKPVIAQIHGYAMAGGLELAGACDLAYAASDAALSHPVLRFAGLPDFAWFPVFLAPRHAMELHLTGRVYSGEEAARIGLVNQAFPRGGARGARARDREDDRRDAARRGDREQALRLHRARGARRPQRDPHRRRPPGRPAPPGRARERRGAQREDQGRAAEAAGAWKTASRPCSSSR